MNPAFQVLRQQLYFEAEPLFGDTGHSGDSNYASTSEKQLHPRYKFKMQTFPYEALVRNQCPSGLICSDRFVGPESQT